MHTQVGSKFQRLSTSTMTFYSNILQKNLGRKGQKWTCSCSDVSKYQELDQFIFGYFIIIIHVIYITIMVRSNILRSTHENNLACTINQTVAPSQLISIALSSDVTIQCAHNLHQFLICAINTCINAKQCWYKIFNTNEYNSILFQI